MDGKLNITIKDESVLGKIYKIPKTFRGRFVEAALTNFINTEIGSELHRFCAESETKEIEKSKAGKNSKRKSKELELLI